MIVINFFYKEHGVGNLKLFGNGRGIKGRRLYKTMGRGSIIDEKMVGLSVGVHNGLRYFPVTIKYEMIGFHLGDFIFTKNRSSIIHVGNKVESKKFKTKNMGKKKKFGVKKKIKKK
jgi:ribosomal protein S19